VNFEGGNHMAENDAMEGKNLAAAEKQKQEFEDMIKDAINSKEKGQTESFLQNGIITMKIIQTENSYKVSLLNKDIATISKDGKFTYNIKELEEVKKSLENQKRPIANYKDLGLPDIEYLKELEKDKTKDERDIEASEIKEKDEKNKDNEEKSEEENEVKEEQEKDEEKPKLNSKKPNWIKLDLSKEVVENTPLRNLIPNCEKYEEVYIVPGKDQYSYTIQGGNKENGYEVINELERTEGNNPNQKIISLEGDGTKQVETKQALAMFKIKGREDEGFSITEAQPGNEQIRMEYWRKAYGDMYISTTVPQAHADRGMDRPTPEVRHLMSKNYTSRLEMEKIFETHEDLENLEKQDVPEQVNPAADGIQLEELDREEFKEKMYEKVLQDLKNEKGNQPPGFLESKAKYIVNKVVDEGERYNEVKEAAFDDGKEKGGPTPDQKRNREG
jgi:hypothetical protein